CLARQIPALIDMGVASLKIEGRMKSPEYVGAVTKIYRRLLDERRAATEDEVAHLSEIFSRGGFTDGYFRNRIGAEMLGVRSESDKEASRALAPFKGLTRTVPVSLAFTAKKDEKISLTMSNGERSVTVKGSVPLAAERAPTDRAAVERQITKLGGTVYSPASVSIDLDDGLMIPVGWLNALRRDAVAAFSRPDADPIAGERTPIRYADPETALHDAFPNESGVPRKERKAHRSARFLSPVQITPRAKEYFDVRYLPLFCFRKDAGANGVILPPVVYDNRRETVKTALIGAVRDGATHVLLTNLGQCALIREAETETGTALTVTGDFRLGVTNRYALDFVRAAGVGGAILSPELTLPQLRDLSACGSTETIVYGRLPLMLLEKCVNIGRNGKKTGDKCVACMKNHEGCDNENAHIPSARLVDRKRVEFPVLREWEHRNVIYNSVPTYMADRTAELVRARISEWHFLFSVESPDEVDRVIDAYKKGTPPKGAVRRI
ncbi:MAG: DUF3656 domain-containing protein, partial [Clostridia bacterium]|nr:DUF3656 domain-containing protein [Clostridia bacterium]